MSAKRLVAGMLCCAGANAQGPIMRSETRTVLVEAVVTGKKGDFVRGLTAKDFHIWQDGKEQAITSASENPKTSEPRFLVFFADDTSMAPADSSRARQAVSHFIDADSTSNRMMAVASYVRSLRIAQNFTSNPGRLKDAIFRVETQVSGTPGAAFDSRNMLRALTNLAKNLGVLPGRKTVVLLTGSIPSTPDMKAEVAAAIDASSKSDVAIYPINVQPPVGAVDTTHATLGLPQRTGGLGGPLHGTEDTPYAADPAGANLQTLLNLAAGTGGFVLSNSGDLLAGLKRIGEEQTEYYMLSYTPPDSKEGSCHALRVKIDRVGASIRARSGYCSAPPADLIGHTDAAKELESRAASGEVGNLKASIQLPYFYASPGVARVHLAMDLPEPTKPGANPGTGIDLLCIATAQDGSVVARISDTIRPESSVQLERASKPVHYEKVFKIVPGSYRVTLVLRNVAGDFGKIEAPLTIQPWSGAELAVSSPVLSRETQPAGDLGLLSALIGDQNPLVAGGTEYVPSGSAQFGKSEPGFFYLEIYDPAPASVRVQVRAVDRKSGEVRWDSGVTQPPVSSEGNPVIKAGAGLRIGALGPGSYRLEITATDGFGKQVKQDANFDVY